MKRMLFNATHPEETRVGIVDGQKLIDIDIETAGREARKSNIYMGVVTRIEPSLEACFIDYGEERHGFLPFKEISRSYFAEGVDVRLATIKEAIHEGQELIVQVEKEERGNKGAALTTFISLAGRYLVLMPNNPRAGGVSRRIEGEERQELREAMNRLKLPNGMSTIARTAGIGRTTEELQWDLNYLLKLWEAITDAARPVYEYPAENGHTKLLPEAQINGKKGKRANPAPFLIVEESNLVVRAIRDYFQPEIGEILVDTDDIYEQARQFMAHVMPDMVDRVKRYRDDIPLFTRFQIEQQIETAYSRTVPLPSGGAIVIDHTEALVAIDVNSARATRGADIEETAFKTNCEAADEVARQMRLRDLGGLIVIDFIDMAEAKNQRAVEQRLKDAIRYDRARVQTAKISRFGLMELSRQRLRPSLSEGSHITCPRCNGVGVIRDTESCAIQVLRILQEEAMKEGTGSVRAQVPVDVATFLLNEKRNDITKLEARHRVPIVLVPNTSLETPHYHIERIRQDDERLEVQEPSFKLAETIETVADDPYAQKSQEEKPLRPKQVPVIKNLIERDPAPVQTAESKKAEQKANAGRVKQLQPVEPKKSLFKRIIGFFLGTSDDKAEQSEKSAKTNKSSQKKDRDSRADERRRARGARGDRQERGDRRRAARGERLERTDRLERQEAAEKTEKTERQERTRRQRPERAERTERTERVERSDRQDREDRRRSRKSAQQQSTDVTPEKLTLTQPAVDPELAAAEAAPSQDVDAVVTEAVQAEAPAAQQPQDEERRSRRRRQRRRPADETTETAAVPETPETSEAPTLEAPEAAVPEVQKTEAADSQEGLETPEADEAAESDAADGSRRRRPRRRRRGSRGEGEAAEGSDAAAEMEAPKSADAAQAFAEAAQPTWTPAPEALVQIETKPNAVSEAVHGAFADAVPAADEAAPEKKPARPRRSRKPRAETVKTEVQPEASVSTIEVSTIEPAETLVQIETKVPTKAAPAEVPAVAAPAPVPVVRAEALAQAPVEVLEQVETKVQPIEPVEETKAVIEAIEAAEPAEAVETVEVTQAYEAHEAKVDADTPAVSEGLAANLSAAGLQQVETKVPSAATGYVPVIQPGRAVAASAAAEDEGPLEQVHTRPELVKPVDYAPHAAAGRKVEAPADDIAQEHLVQVETTKHE
ncbi:Rne/Rng family ribonuclease [Sutterella wadsworthensis]|uniref:Rne/Rng family ribonuclease n=1 Tax=Sutterella wadsworthensis TaxID=40545 RepID=UPI002666A87D|nr:ribonuclease E/G [Sutterella wadsworthensis]